MSTDINGVSHIIIMFHTIWGRFVELFVSIYVLSSVMGSAAFFLVIPFISKSQPLPGQVNTKFKPCMLTLLLLVVLIVLTMSLTKPMAGSRRKWTEKIEERTAASSYILSQLKSIKISGFSPLMGDYLHKKRLTEIHCSRRERLIRISLHTLRKFAEA